MMSQELLSPLLTCAQVAEYLGVSLWTVQKRIKAGEIASVKLGRTRRVCATALAEYVKQGEYKEATAPAPVKKLHECRKESEA